LVGQFLLKQIRRLFNFKINLGLCVKNGSPDLLWPVLIDQPNVLVFWNLDKIYFSGGEWSMLPVFPQPTGIPSNH
jgi:hypothetical protein